MKNTNSSLPQIPFHPVLVVAAMNLFLLLMTFLLYCSSLSKPAGFEISIPRLAENEGVQNDQTIIVTAENVFYFNDKVVTFNELKKELSKIDVPHRNILIRANRHALMGRVMDVWDLCRSLGKAQIHIVTDQRN